MGRGRKSFYGNARAIHLTDKFGTMRIAQQFLKDARHFQIVYLSLFLVYGIFYLGWQADISAYGLVIGTCLGVQGIFIGLTGKSRSSLKSALITALGLCLLLKVNNPATLVFAASVAISSKFLIRVNQKHLFNPANIGIIAALAFSGDAWVSPGQWGNNALMVYFFGAAALMVLLKVGRIDTSLAFLATFAVLEYLRTVVFLGWGMDVLTHKLSSGTLLLFAFFMITDPVTTPNAPKARILWASGIALLTFFLTNWFYVHTAPIWALIIYSPLTVMLDRLFVYQKFKWIEK